MEKYTPPFSITNNMLLYISQISEKVGVLNVTNGLSAKPHLRKNYRIKSIYASLKIEANSLSLNQVQDVINGKLIVGEKREIQEVKNAYAAYEQLPEINPFDIKQLLRLHGIMTKYLQDESGVFRSGNEGVFDGDKCVFVAPQPRLVPELIKKLFAWMKSAKNTVHPLILAGVFHYEFVFIHPFSDGNGRMARLWHTAILAKWKPIFEYIPLESQIEKFQNEYYEAIAACHVNGDSTVFVEFMLKQTNAVLDELINQTANTEGLSQYVQRLLSVMDMSVPYSANELMELLHLKSKETFRKNYLNPAMKLNLVQFVLPEKPKSKNQRYIKK